MSERHRTDTPDPPSVKKYVFIFLLLIIAPLLISAANYLLGDRRGNRQMADRSSAGLLPAAFTDFRRADRPLAWNLCSPHLDCCQGTRRLSLQPI